MIIPDDGNTARFSGVSPKSVCAFNALSLRGGLSLVEKCQVYGYFTVMSHALWDGLLLRRGLFIAEKMPEERKNGRSEDMLPTDRIEKSK